MSKLKSLTAEFSLVGQLLGFILKEGDKVKYLRLSVSEREYWIKLPKELRQHLDPAIYPGCWLEIRGIQERCLKTGKLKLKAEILKRVGEAEFPPAAGVPPGSAKAPKARILVCQKSDCRRRGGEAICEEIEANLRDRGLEEQVQVKRTGCLKQCKKGPNLLILPDKARYSNVRPQQIPALLEKHFSR